MEAVTQTVPLNVMMWILGIVIGALFAVVGVIYGNIRKRVDVVDQDLNDYKSCTDRRIEALLLDLTKVNERVISKSELTEAINNAVTEQFLKWENRLLKDGQIKPSKKGE